MIMLLQQDSLTDCINLSVQIELFCQIQNVLLLNSVESVLGFAQTYAYKTLQNKRKHFKFIF